MIIDRENLSGELLNIPQGEFEQVHVDEIWDEKFKTKPIGFFKDAMIRLAKTPVSIVSVSVIVLIILLALIVPGITGYEYTAQNKTESGKVLMNLPPKIPYLEKLGIFDGSRVLTNKQVASLSDTARFPEGSVLEIVREYEYLGVPMCDVRVDFYKFSRVADGTYSDRVLLGHHERDHRRHLRCDLRLLRREGRPDPDPFRRGAGRPPVHRRDDPVHAAAWVGHAVDHHRPVHHGVDRDEPPDPRAVLPVQGP